MRRRQFEVLCEAGIGLRSGEPGAFYSVVDKRSWYDWLIPFPRRALYRGKSPADCHQWIERYRQAEKDVAAFNGAV